MVTGSPLKTSLDALGVPYELFACDPALADTANFCAAYGFKPEESANTILVIGKSATPVYAACVVLANTRLDVNKAVKQRLGTRKASFRRAIPARSWPRPKWCKACSRVWTARLSRPLSRP